MVSSCCKAVVQTTLQELGLCCSRVDLGEVEVEGTIAQEQLEPVRIALLRAGFELIDDKKRVLTERIKGAVIDMVHYAEEESETKNSEYISRKLAYDYTYLANVFSEITGTTIEHYMIAHRIERVKELISYNELNITQIANKLNYSSVSHLSNQFKKVTGLTPSLFRQLEYKRRIPRENVGIV